MQVLYRHQRESDKAERRRLMPPRSGPPTRCHYPWHMGIGRGGVHDEEMRRGYILMCAAVSSALGCFAGCDGLLNMLLRPTRRRWLVRPPSSGVYKRALVAVMPWASSMRRRIRLAVSSPMPWHLSAVWLYGLCLAANGPVPEVAVGFTECSTCDWPSARQSFRCAATALFVGAHPTPEMTKTGRRWLQWLVIIRIR